MTPQVLRHAVRRALHLGRDRGDFAEFVRADLCRVSRSHWTTLASSRALTEASPRTAAMIRPVLTEIALFLAPFVVYARLPVGDARGRARSATLAAGALCLAAHRGARADDRQLHRARAVGRRAAGLDLCSGAYRGRPDSCRARPSERPPRRLDAAWLREAPLARSARRARPRRRGGARGRRRGAQRAPRRAAWRHRHRHHRAARRGDPPGRRRRASRRCRPASSTAPSPSSPTAGRSRSPRCARTSRPSAATPRSRSAATGGATPSAATSP